MTNPGAAWWAGAAVVWIAMALEAVRSVRHERALRRAGAREPSGDVYRAMALAYPGGFLAMMVEGWWRGQPAVHWLFAGAVVFALAKALKYWAIATLGARWTFRVLVPPGAVSVAGGPYRWVSHPNYAGVAGEFLGAWAWFGAWGCGPMGTAAFLFLMWRRVRIEDRALRAGPGLAGSRP